MAAGKRCSVYGGGDGDGCSSQALLQETGEKLAVELEAAGLDVLLDDRDERAGGEIREDADLVGIPYRVNVGIMADAEKVLERRRSRLSSGRSIQGRNLDPGTTTADRVLGVGEIHFDA